MRYLTKPAKTLNTADRNRINAATARNRFQKQLRVEQLEDRRLLAVVAAWSAENTAFDTVGGNNGTLFNGATYAVGQVGQAFSFDGVNDRIDVDDSLSLSLSGSLTIEAWIKASDVPTQHRGAIFFRGSSGIRPYQLTLESGGTLIFDIQSSTARARMSAPMPLGQFVHVAATLDDATGSMRIYVNSVLMSQITTTVRPHATLDPSSNPKVGIGDVGGNPTSVDNFFSGLIDELAIYDHALSETEVAAHYNAGKGSLQPALSVSDSSITEGKASIQFLDRFVQDASGGLNYPRALVFGPDGNADAIQDLYVADIVTNSILRYDGATGAFLDVFVEPGDGGLNAPGDLAFDSNSNLLVTGTSSNQIHKYDSSGAFVGIVASGLNAPYGIEIASDGSLLIANSGTDEILKVTGGVVKKYIRSGSGGLDEPRNVVIGPDGDLYVTSLLTASVLRYDRNTGAPKGTFVSNPSGGDMMWAEFGPDGHLYASYRTTPTSLNVTLARFNGTTGALENSRDNGRDSWSFTVGTNNIIYNAGNGGGNYVDRFVVTQDAAFTISLNAPFPDPVTVDFTTANASALSGNYFDYSSVAGTITFLPGQFSKTILVPILDDATYEGNETFFVNLSNPIGGIIVDWQGVGTIVDNELPPSPATKFYVVNDGSPDRTYEYNAAGDAVENYTINSGNTSPRGAASNAAGDTVWVADKNRKVYVYDTSGGPRGSWSAGTLANNAIVEGIVTNGTDVWIVDSRSDKVYRYSGAASLLDGSKNADNNTFAFALNSANTNPKGIVTDGNYLWVVNDSTTDKVFKYRLNGNLVNSWTIDSANKTPTGLTIDPTGASQSIWIVDSGTDTVYEYDNARGTALPSLPASAFALASGNTNPQGIADPPPSGSGLVVARPPAVPSVSAIAPPLDSVRPNPVTVNRWNDGQSKDLPLSDVPAAWLSGLKATSLETTRNPLTLPLESHPLPLADATDHTDHVFSLDDPFDTLDESLLELLAHQR